MMMLLFWQTWEMGGDDCSSNCRLRRGKIDNLGRRRGGEEGLADEATTI
jgi:hypothetical protein